MYSNVVTAIDKILRSYYVSTLQPFLEVYGCILAWVDRKGCRMGHPKAKVPSQSWATSDDVH